MHQDFSSKNWRWTHKYKGSVREQKDTSFFTIKKKKKTVKWQERRKKSPLRRPGSSFASAPSFPIIFIIQLVRDHWRGFHTHTYTHTHSDVGCNHTLLNHQLWLQVSVNDSNPAGSKSPAAPLVWTIPAILPPPPPPRDNISCPLCSDREGRLYTAHVNKDTNTSHI